MGGEIKDLAGAIRRGELREAAGIAFEGAPA
jgi:hypothetical protein